MFDVIYHKLSRSLNRWKHASSLADNRTVTGDGGTAIDSPLHTWVIPWLPRLDYKSMLQNLLPEAKRRVENSVTFLSKKHRGTDTDAAFFEAGIASIRPWCGILDAGVPHHIVSDYVLPRLGRHLSRIDVPPFEAGDADLQWSSLAVSPRRTDEGVVAAGSSMDVCLLRTEDRYIMVAGWLRSLPFRWQWQLIGTNNRNNAIPIQHVRAVRNCTYFTC